MSKASEWAARLQMQPNASFPTPVYENRPTGEIRCEAVMKSAGTLDNDPRVRLAIISGWKGSYGSALLDVDEALRMAHWILDTFGEADASGASAS